MDSERVRQALNHLNNTRRLLDEGCEVAKSSVRSNLSRQAEALHSREAWLLHQIDLHRADRHEALTRHQEALLAAAAASAEAPEDNQLRECLEQLLRRRPTQLQQAAFVTFRADSTCLREVLSQYGCVRFGAYTGHFAEDESRKGLPLARSLPRAVEDYEEDLEDVEHKSVSGDPAWLVRLPGGRPGLPSRLQLSNGGPAVAQWLMSDQANNAGYSDSYDVLSSFSADSSNLVASTESDVFGFFKQVQMAPISEWLISSTRVDDKVESNVGQVLCCKHAKDCGGSFVEIESLAQLRCASSEISESDAKINCVDESSQKNSSRCSDYLLQHLCNVASSPTSQWLLSTSSSIKEQMEGLRDEKDTEEAMEVSESAVPVAGVCRANSLCRSFNECCLLEPGVMGGICCNDLAPNCTVIPRPNLPNQWLHVEKDQNQQSVDLLAHLRVVEKSSMENWLHKDKLKVDVKVDTSERNMSSNSWQRWLANSGSTNAAVMKSSAAPEKCTVNNSAATAVKHQLWLNRYVQALLTELPEHEADESNDKWLLKRCL